MMIEKAKEVSGLSPSTIIDGLVIIIFIRNSTRYIITKVIIHIKLINRDCALVVVKTRILMKDLKNLCWNAIQILLNHVLSIVTRLVR